MSFHTYDGIIGPDDAPSIHSVAVALCRETRYCGNSPRWWNVGLHSFVVADLLPNRLKIHGLIHDEPESCTGDIPHDLKTDKQRAFEDVLLERFYKKYGITPLSATDHHEVKLADRLAVHGEVWAGSGTRSLKTKYDYRQGVCNIVHSYMRAYTFTDCLDPIRGAAIAEFERRFDEYRKFC